MRIAISQVHVIDPSSDWNNKVINVLIDQGRIVSISTSENFDGELTIDGSNMSLSPGWLDLRANFCEPGFEHREDLKSAAKAATHGGFTSVAITPETEPVLDTKDAVGYLISKSTSLSVNLFPLGAISKNLKGKELTEMYDLWHEGVLGFTDGNSPVWHSGILMKGLEYLQGINAPILTKSYDKYLMSQGQMHEGEMSTSLGLKGISSLSEIQNVKRDLDLLEYAGGKLHLSCISTKESVQLVAEAKSKGLDITCDIAAHQLAFTDEDLSTFDSFLKVNPPFRSSEDKSALIQGLKSGVIDCVVSDHNPHDEECKKLEFDLADFGISSIETTFLSLNTFGECSDEKIVELLAINPRKVLGLETPTVREGGLAEFTLFSTDQKTNVDQLKSKSKNNPFVGKTLKGKVFGTINKGQYFEA